MQDTAGHDEDGAENVSIDKWDPLSFTVQSETCATTKKRKPAKRHADEDTQTLHCYFTNNSFHAKKKIQPILISSSENKIKYYYEEKIMDW